MCWQGSNKFTLLVVSRTAIHIGSYYLQPVFLCRSRQAIIRFELFFFSLLKVQGINWVGWTNCLDKNQSQERLVKGILCGRQVLMRYTICSVSKWDRWLCSVLWILLLSVPTATQICLTKGTRQELQTDHSTSIVLEKSFKDMSKTCVSSYISWSCTQKWPEHMSY